MRTESDHKGPKHDDRNSDKWLLLSVPKCLGSAAKDPEAIWPLQSNHLHIYECYSNDFKIEFKNSHCWWMLPAKKPLQFLYPIACVILQKHYKQESKKQWVYINHLSLVPHGNLNKAGIFCFYQIILYIALRNHLLIHLTALKYVYTIKKNFIILMTSNRTLYMYHI